MPSWEIHRKWANKLGISKNVADEVNRLIDFPERWFEEKYPERYDRIMNRLEVLRITDIFDADPCIALLKSSLAMNVFGHDVGRGRKWQGELQLKCIFNQYGIQGVKAALLHHILDYIETTTGEKHDVLNRIKQKLQGTRFDGVLFQILSFVDAHWSEILQDLNKRSIRKRSSRASIKGIKGVFIVDGVILPPVPAILKIRKEVKHGKRVWVEWSYSSYRIRRTISSELELNELISEIKSKTA
ncbi:hypothetical protein [Palaeococcus sp. (in: euryarchaeotes)]